MPYFTTEGLSLYYREKGTGDLLLILPGNTASSACHGAELDYFGQAYHAVSVDFRGTGLSTRISPWPQGWWEKCADDLASLVSHLGKERSIVMGTSGGAQTALLFAIHYPELASAVIADSCVEFHSPENLRSEVAERGLRKAEQIAFWSHANGEDWAEVVAADTAMLLDFADRGGDLYHGQLHRIKCPVLFTGSLKDSFLADLGEQNIHMAKQVRNSRLFLCHDGDHPLMWTCPDVFRAVCDQFLTELASG